MRIDFMPKTRLGKLAVGLGIVLVALTAISFLFALAVGGDSAVIDNNHLLLMLANALSIMFSFVGPLSFFVGIFAIIKNKERPVFASLAILYALTFLIFMLGEILFPH